MTQGEPGPPAWSVAAYEEEDRCWPIQMSPEFLLNVGAKSDISLFSRACYDKDFGKYISILRIMSFGEQLSGIVKIKGTSA